ncbi:MAG: hypothetical protein WB780_20305 [Candidatus Acidiferrales bacterium]
MTADNLQSELVFAYASSWAIQLLKTSKWFPILTTETQRLNKVASALIAIMGSAGIIITSQHVGAGAWTLSITGLTLANVYHVAGHAIRIYMLQKASYKGLIPKAPPTTGNAKPHGQ